jgi:prefoldin subunit 5
MPFNEKLFAELEQASRRLPPRYGVGATLESRVNLLLLAGITMLLGKEGGGGREIANAPEDLSERLERIEKAIQDLAQAMEKRPAAAPRSPQKRGAKK